nr:hypothetical protein [Tanacetum cinerariifolium]
MAAGSRDRPPMLTTGRYPQWCSRFLRYIDTRPNGEALRKCILSGPHKPTTVLVQAVEATGDSPAVPKHTTVAFCLNLHFVSEDLAFCPQKILRFVFRRSCVLSSRSCVLSLKHCVLPNSSYLAFCLCTAFCLSHESCVLSQKHCVLPKPNGDALRKCILSGPYKPTTVLVQVVAITNDSPAIPEHTTVETPMNMSLENKAHFQAEKEAIHLILTGIGDEIYSTVDACQTAQEIGKGYAEEFGSHCEYFKKIYKPTNNNLKTSSNSRNKNVDTTPRFKNDNQSGQFENQRTINVARARENVGSLVVQQSGIQCFNYKEFRHFAKECKKPKRVKDFAYHKEKILLCKQAKQGVLLQAEQHDWLADTDEEIDEQELEAHYSNMAKIQEVPMAVLGTDFEPLEQVQNKAGYNGFANDLQHSEQSESISNTCLVETNDSNVISNSPDMFNDDIQNEQNDVESDDERVTLANLIANLKLDVDENKKIQKQLKKANTTLA